MSGDTVNILCRCGPRHAPSRTHVGDSASRKGAASDPTGTFPIRRAFSKDLDTRWVKLKRSLPAAVTAQLNPVNMVGGDAVRAFQSWIDAAMNHLVLGANGSWTLNYVRQAGDAALLRAAPLVGTPDTTPVVNDRIPTLQTLAVTELQGIMEAVSQQAVRTLAEGLLTKQPPNKIARLIQQVIDKAGVERGHLLVSFITVRAFGTVTLDAFRASGITHVGTVAERTRPANSPHRPGLVRDAKKKKSPLSKFKGLEVVEVLTAGDDDVCPVCEEISEAGPYELDEAEMLIPAHPRCRCAFVPAYDARFAGVRDGYDPNEDRDGHGRWSAGGANDIVLYHGTSRSLLKSIKQHGLVPSGLQQKELGAKARGGDAWAAKEGLDVHKFTVGDRALSVYMTTNPDTAIQFSLTAADVNRSEPLILQLRIPREKVKDIVEDEYAGGMQAFRFKGKVTPDMIDRVAFTRQGKIDLASVNDAMSDLVIYAVAFVDGNETVIDGFNPDQFRDKNGKWATGGAGKNDEKPLEKYLAFTSQHSIKDRFILEHGKEYKFDKSSFDGPRDQQRLCYMNAGRIALNNPDRTYVEGYVSFHGIPIQHAWTVDDKGKVYDSTLKYDENIKDYFGVPFKEKYVAETALKTKVWGILSLTNMSLFKATNTKKIIADMLAADFDPDEARDDHGRWTMSGHVSDTMAQDLLALHSDGTETMADVDRQLTPAQRHEMQLAENALVGKVPTNVQFMGPDGKYLPERAALHADILSQMFGPDEIAHAIPKPGQRPVLIITGGRPAAGKTSTLKGELAGADKHSFYISADTIQEYLPHYDGKQAGLFNGEAQDIALQAEKIARDSRLNITYDATLKSQKPAIERVQHYKDDGYDVHGYFVHTSPVTSAVRSAQRYMDSGRYVPPVVSFNSRTNEKTFDALIPKLDKWAIYDNNGEKPRLVARGKK